MENRMSIVEGGVPAEFRQPLEDRTEVDCKAGRCHSHASAVVREPWMRNGATIVGRSLGRPPPERRASNSNEMTISVRAAAADRERNETSSTDVLDQTRIRTATRRSM